MAPKIHYFGLSHQAVTPAFSLVILALIAFLTVALIAIRRRAHG
jgi:hypothetical protein